MRSRVALISMLVVMIAAVCLLPDSRFASVVRTPLKSLSVAAPAELVSLTPDRIGIFIGVNGVTFTSDGSKFGYHAEYLDRETIVVVPAAVLNNVAAQLHSAGLFKEAKFNDPQDISIPISHSIEIGLAQTNRTFSWISQGECSVPEKYLKIFETLNRTYSSESEVVTNFIVHNRTVSRQHEARKREFEARKRGQPPRK